MGLFKNGLAAIGRLLIVVALAGTFLVGLVGVVYLQLSGEEVEIPKVVGKNFNIGKDELTQNGLKIKKIATRYSNEEPNTILEQRPKAGTVAKTGLMISVIVSEPNPDGSSTPVDVKNDEEAIEEIESLPELKTDKTKKKAKNKAKKEDSKTRDVIKEKDESDSKEEDSAKSDGSVKTETVKPGDDGKDVKKVEPKTDVKKDPPPVKKDKPVPPKTDNKKPPTSGDSRSRQVQKGN
jgi:hypothetical protein